MTNHHTTRRTLVLAGLAGLAAAPMLPGLVTAAAATEGDVLSRDAVLRDPDAPAVGNPKGDITIVEYFDYQCPYCKTVHAELKQVMRDDPKVRVVYKDWPIFGGPSGYAARLALASRRQNKYLEVHEALLGVKEKLSEESVRTTLAGVGVDVEQALAELQTNRTAIEAALTRHHTQATAFGFSGTPAFIIGYFRVPGALDAATFKRAIKDARAAAAKGAK
ncbi:thioredoxin domain-containing protein [Rhodoplanes serenus]|jgi:protein-disulfide isomerase|uniref:Thioredoxin domain-containing protein n=1 Tax=Rhodoplanes serenus TaxID=200615 RepID=A0A9X4XJB0_9BRAD|nr:DsbA family protein [Rhodoplanes serenus]MTW16078.1 thioredoxin domain-containing protein [Rhodoplanes serenus]